MRCTWVMLLAGLTLLSLRGCTPGTPQVDIQIYFVPHDQLSQYHSRYVPGNNGSVSINWGPSGEAADAIVLIASDTTNQLQRDHAIREELTQCLGLLNDSDFYADSVFYRGDSTATSYSPLDRSLIEMLYQDAVTIGMDSQQAAAALANRYNQQQIDYFMAVACGAEYDASDNGIHKWTHSPAIQVHGSPTPADQKTLRQVIGEINELTTAMQLHLIDGPL